MFLRCSKDGHPSESSMRFTLEVLWYRFSTNRAARLWTASNLSVLFWVYGSHADSMGLAKALYAVSFMALELILDCTAENQASSRRVYHVVGVVVPVHILLVDTLDVLACSFSYKQLALPASFTHFLYHYLYLACRLA